MDGTARGGAENNATETNARMVSVEKAAMRRRSRRKGALASMGLELETEKVGVHGVRGVRGEEGES